MQEYPCVYYPAMCARLSCASASCRSFLFLFCIHFGAVRVHDIPVAEGRVETMASGFVPDVNGRAITGP